MVIIFFANMQIGNSALAQNLTVRYPAVQHPYYSERDQYFVKLLKMALSESGQQHDIQAINYPTYSENRSVVFLQAKQYDVHWLNTTVEREAEVEAIKIPLYKGVIGWRALLIKKGKQPEFDRVKTLEDLRQYFFIQGHDWADIEILKNNQMRVEGSTNWAGLFKMVELGRVDAFPRSIVEIVEEHNKFGEELSIEKGVILQYPSAYYFFVHKSNTQLKNAIESGLKVLIEDGRFDKIFFETFLSKIEPLNIENRRVFSIERLVLKNSMPLEQENLWFSVDWYKRMKAKYSHQSN